MVFEMTVEFGMTVYVSRHPPEVPMLSNCVLGQTK